MKSNFQHVSILAPELCDELSSDEYTQIPQLTSSRPLDVQDILF